MRLLLFAAALTIAPLAAHAKPKTPPAPPSVIAAVGEPAPAQARFYAACIAQAAATGAYDREPGANLVRFTCTGEPARAFYEGLAAWSAKIGSQLDAPDAQGQPRTWRFTQKIEKNPFGVDYCSVDAAGGDARCVVVLNVGAFLGFAQ
ncbi:MAG: hypothetical protein ACXWVH_02365 [Caulobacteraceae bacterium]